MALVRTKKLTDAGYAPTNPATEAEARSKVDGSIQEVLDLLDADKASNDTVLTKTNTDAYTPTTQYHPATKGYVDGVAISATIPLDSLTDEYLSSTPGNIKPRVDTLETDFSIAQTDIEIINTAVDDTGTVNNIVIATAGTFDLTKNKNVTPFIIPLFTNTSATVNIAIDGQANKLIKKANDTGTLVALEVGDIKKNVPIQLVWDSVSDFFIFAPKGGSNIKSIQRGTITLSGASTTVTITGIDITKSILKFSSKATATARPPERVAVKGKITNSTTITFNTYLNTPSVIVEWEVVEFNNVRSLQSGDTTTASQTIAITSVNVLKSIIFHSFSVNYAITDSSAMLSFAKITSSTSIVLENVGFTCDFHWQVIEFN